MSLSTAVVLVMYVAGTQDVLHVQYNHFTVERVVCQKEDIIW